MLRSQLMRSGVGGFIVSVAGLLLNLGVSVVLARLFNAGGYGVYALSMAVVNLAAIPVQLGLPQLLIREVALLTRRGDMALLRGLLLRANQAVFLLSVLGVIIAVLAVVMIKDGPLSLKQEALLWSFVLLPIFGLSGVRSATLTGLSFVAQGRFLDTALRPLLFLIIIAVVVFAGIPLTVISAVHLQILATVLAFGVGVLLLLAALPAEVRNQRPAFNDAHWFRAALPFLLLAGGQVAMQHTDTVMMGLLSTSEQTGIYRVVAQCGTLVLFAQSVIVFVVAPHIARLHDGGNFEDLQRLITTAAIAALFGAAPFFVVFALFGNKLLGVFFGPEFASGYAALMILGAGQLFGATMGPVGFVLTMTGNAFHCSIGAVCAAVLNVLLNAALIPTFGMNGAAIATAISLIVWKALLFYWVHRRTGLVSLAFWFGRKHRSQASG